MSRKPPALHHLTCPTCGRSNVTEIATNWCLHGTRSTPRHKQALMIETLPLETENSQCNQ